jgi:membrane-associated phospholipid phosphatase
MNQDAPVQSNKLSAPSGMRGYWIYSILMTIAGWLAMQYDFQFASHDALGSLPGDVRRVLDLSEVFAHGFGVLLILVGVWSMVPEKRRFLPRIVGCVAGPGLTVQIAKHLISRDRPLKFLHPDLSVHFPDSILSTWHGWLPGGNLNSDYYTQSFPSAHTATVVGLAIGLGWIFPRGRLLFFSVALLASLQRITSLAHWSSDVFFGAAIGFLLAGAMTQNWGVGRRLGKLEMRFSTREIPARDPSRRV